MRKHKLVETTLGDLIVALTEEVAPIAHSPRGTNILVSYVLRDLFTRCRVRLTNRPPLPRAAYPETAESMSAACGARRRWPAVALGILLLLSPGFATAGTAADQLRGSIDRIRAILMDPTLKGDSKKPRRWEKLRQVVYSRFDFGEMAKRSLGTEWQKRSSEERKEFVRLFSALVENAYLDKLDSYNGENVDFVNERQDKNFSEVNTKLVDNRGEEFAIDYRLHNVNGDWQVFDVVIENISVVNNYRAQFKRVLAKSSYLELVQSMKEKALRAAGTKS